MTPILIALIVVAVVLGIVVLAQVRGGGLSGVFGGGGESAFRTRRGLEKTLFRFTIALIVVFIILCILSVRFATTT